MEFQVGDIVRVVDNSDVNGSLFFITRIGTNGYSKSAISRYGRYCWLKAADFSRINHPVVGRSTTELEYVYRRGMAPCGECGSSAVHDDYLCEKCRSYQAR